MGSNLFGKMVINKFSLKSYYLCSIQSYIEYLVYNKFMFLRHRVFLGLLSLSLVITFAFGGLFHSAISHNHAHDDVAAESMHASLRHEDKKFILLLIVLAVLSFGTIKLGPDLGFHHAFSRANLDFLKPDSIQLHRGVFAYRKFR